MHISVILTCIMLVFTAGKYPIRVCSFIAQGLLEKAFNLSDVTIFMQFIININNEVFWSSLSVFSSLKEILWCWVSLGIDLFLCFCWFSFYDSLMCGNKHYCALSCNIHPVICVFNNFNIYSYILYA